MSRTCPECQNQYEDEILHCPEDGLDLSGVEPDDELIGRDIGSYRVTKLLGKGGMGAVYMAEHPVIGSRVAIKFLHPQYATDKKIPLSVVSEPVGAIVEATWKEGVKGGVTPFDLSVPTNVSVRFTFSKRDFVSWTTDVIADTPKVVRASLLAEPKPAPPPRVLKGKSEGSDKKARQAASKEDDIPVEF